MQSFDRLARGPRRGIFNLLIYSVSPLAEAATNCAVAVALLQARDLPLSVQEITLAVLQAALAAKARFRISFWDAAMNMLNLRNPRPSTFGLLSAPGPRSLRLSVLCLAFPAFDPVSDFHLRCLSFLL